ncbi:MAG: amino acid ABC transporter permease [Oscillospiraceae bacterium]|nr:amino acid ABC transporter permease [Oscillospiraceae bacterium]
MLPQDFLGRVLFLLNEYGTSLIKGAGVTMIIAIVCTLLGCVIGFAVGIVQTIPLDRKNRPIHWFLLRLLQILLSAYVEIFRGTPMMVQAMFIYYGAAAIFGLNMSMWTAAIFIVSINTGAYMAESVRGGILSIDAGQTEGAKAIGMTHFQTMMYVILPQALRNIMPQIGNNLIINIKDTCVLSVIGTVELYYTTRGIAGTYYTYFEAFAITMVIYFILTFTCSRILRVMENKMDGPVNYELVMQDPLVAGTGTYKFNEKKHSQFNDQNMDTREGGR